MPDIVGLSVSPGAVVVLVVPAALWIVALVCAVMAIRRGKRPITYGFVVDRLLRYILIFPLGLQSLWAFLCHVFVPGQAASAIGWEPSPFQYELGVANLGIGVAALYAAFHGFQARAAVAVMAAGFLAGEGVGHIKDIMLGGNLAPGNAGPILYTDFLTPIALLVLSLVSPRTKLKEKEKSAEEKPAATAIHDPTAAAIDDATAAATGDAIESSASPRLEDELEQAREAMPDQLKSGPIVEILPPLEPAVRPGTSLRRAEVIDISDG